MDLPRLLVTVLGVALIVAVNLYFFTRPGSGGVPGRPGRPGVKPGRVPADDAPEGRQP
jgi:hypothetical protein